MQNNCYFTNMWQNCPASQQKIPSENQIYHQCNCGAVNHPLFNALFYAFQNHFKTQRWLGFRSSGKIRIELTL